MNRVRIDMASKLGYSICQEIMIFHWSNFNDRARLTIALTSQIPHPSYKILIIMLIHVGQQIYTNYILSAN